MATGIAVVFHAALFLPIRPLVGATAGVHMDVPSTRYQSGGHTSFSRSGPRVRTVSSPVLFSLPSKMGFSREFFRERIQTPRFDPGSGTPERFLDVPGMRRRKALNSENLMLIALIGSEPAVPDDVYGADVEKPAARRVSLAPELKSRLVGGVVLPAELNQEVSKPWAVRAEVSISGDGLVEHVFLEEPLDSAPLNQSVLKMLHGLNFSAGDQVEGVVEIYSPETQPVPPSVSDAGEEE
ncbi:hypothetical protein P9H32_14095 [Pontiella sp. NLcol2]|uniref:Uncharacterized protein n=2 Tax=Pontiella agarivorans TaxID=3038953 RepID=A0ABU5N0K2_9BACT|nr:hypothetical protein [Pontiella agarivorans]